MTSGWAANHNAYAFGDNNLWVLDNTPYSWGHFKRQDIPTHFALAEGWTVADMYSQSVIASTVPNRGVQRASLSSFEVIISHLRSYSVLGYGIHQCAWRPSNSRPRRRYHRQQRESWVRRNKPQLLSYEVEDVS